MDIGGEMSDETGIHFQLGEKQASLMSGFYDQLREAEKSLCEEILGETKDNMKKKDITSSKAVRRGISEKELDRIRWVKAEMYGCKGDIERMQERIEYCIAELETMEMDYYDERDDDEL